MDPILCDSCGTRFRRSQFSDDECQALKDRHYAEASARTVQCPSCQTGTLSVPSDSWDAFEAAGADSIAWYYPESHTVGPDGTLTMHCSGWSGDAHWSGAHIVGPERSDYPFWRWLAEQRKFHRGIGSQELPAIRAEWSRCTGNPP